MIFVKGMGKTLEMLSLMLATIGESDMRDEGVGGTLIICPTSVLDHWYGAFF